jgi:hypothetical protein
MTSWSDYILVPVGDPGTFELSIAILVRMIWLAAYIWFVVEGFKADWKWGAGNLLCPVVALGFFYCYRERGRRPGLLWLAGTVLFILTMFIFRKG